MSQTVKEQPPAVQSAPAEKTRPKSPAPRKLPPYNVVLLDDNDHTYEYVIDMLGRLFGFGKQTAYLKAKEVDTTGRVILITTTKEHAEFKREQIHGFGADIRMSNCKGSMSAIIEPAE
jgi:ATP-dependent Clp protease adaptor protein ClpS